MKTELIHKPEIKLVGLYTRTNNQNEMNLTTAKIGELAALFWNQDMAKQILNRTNPGITFSVYTEYESNEYGEYTYFIGEEVHDFENIPSQMRELVISPARYQKFTTPPGKMPDVVINAWQEIWKITSEDLGGTRAYQADFEIYDERAKNPLNTMIDIYIGIKT